VLLALQLLMAKKYLTTNHSVIQVILDISSIYETMGMMEAYAAITFSRQVSQDRVIDKLKKIGS